MDRTYEFNIREHVYSLSRMLIDFAESTIRKSWDLATTIESRQFTKILLICENDYYPAATTAVSFLTAATNLSVEVLHETDALSLVSQQATKDTHNMNYLILDIFPVLTNSSSVEIMENFKLLGNYVVCFTDQQTYYASKHAHTVFSLSTPKLRVNLPARNYTMSLMALLSLSHILCLRRKGANIGQLKSISYSLHDAAFALTQALPSIDADTLSFAHKIISEENISFVGSGFDYSSALLSKLLLSNYTLKHSQIYDTFSVLENHSLLTHSSVIVFSSIYNQTHCDLKHAIDANRIQSSHVCIVTDDSSIVCTDHYDVIHIPLIDKNYSPLFQVVVPALLAGYLFP